MIDVAAVEQILTQYKKHGWVLRRVLLSSLATDLDLDIFGEIVPQGSEIDALWFSRRSQPGREAWELRRVSGSPFALVQVIEDESDNDEHSYILKSLEQSMAASPTGPVSH